MENAHLIAHIKCLKFAISILISENSKSYVSRLQN